jgi:predicted alternative tryptophan synthase beta-subunit
MTRQKSAANELKNFPAPQAALGCAISEAVETAVSTPGYRYVLGSVLNQVLLHQSVIGEETKTAMDKYGVKPDIIIGCAGGGSNLGGLIAPFMGRKLRGEADYRYRRRRAGVLPELHARKVSPTTSATPAWSARSPRCTRWAPSSYLPRTTRAACATTA